MKEIVITEMFVHDLTCMGPPCKCKERSKAMGYDDQVNECGKDWNELKKRKKENEWLRRNLQASLAHIRHLLRIGNFNGPGSVAHEARKEAEDFLTMLREQRKELSRGRRGTNTNCGVADDG